MSPDEALDTVTDGTGRRNHSGWQLLGLWVLTRAAMGLFFYGFTAWAAGDVGYYFHWIAALPDNGLATTLQEYPTPVVWILQLPYLLGGGTPQGYAIAFPALMAVLDLGLLALLWHAAGRRLHPAPLVWVLFGCCVGWLGYVRFDMIPAVLVGAALVLFWRRPGLAGGLLGLGAAVKLWPALLFPALLSARHTRAGRLPNAATIPAKQEGAGRRPTRAALTFGFVIIGFGLALVSLIAGGLTRLLSPLTWQDQRGLQIESVWTTPLLVANALRPDDWQIRLSSFNAFEIFGPGVEAWLRVSSTATVIGMIMIVVLLGLAYALRDPQPWELTLLGLIIVLIMIITNKTLSPQYVIWLGGPLAVLLLAADTRSRRRQAFALVAAGAVIAVLTQFVFPLDYTSITDPDTAGRRWRGVVLLAVRNVGLLALTAWAIVLYVRDTLAGIRAERDEPEPAAVTPA